MFYKSKIMKNIFLLPTDKPSKLGYISESKTYHLYNNDVFLDELANAINIYITSDEEIKRNDYYIHNNKVRQSAGGEQEKGDYKNCKKIILTTDPTLIVDGVQSIDNEFLEWFVKNPSCEYVEIDKGYRGVDLFNYKIIIPQEEPKQEFLLFDKERADTITSEGQKTVRELQNTIQQETLEEAAENESEYLADWEDKSMYVRGFVNGAKYQAERMYSRQDVLDLLYKRDLYLFNRDETKELELPNDWFEQNKKI